MDRVERLCGEIGELDPPEIEKILRRCKTLLALRSSGSEMDRDLEEVFDLVKSVAQDAGVRTTNFGKETLDAQRRASQEILDIMREHGPSNKLWMASLIKDMVRREVDDMREMGLADVGAKHLWSRLASPRTTIEKMYPGYIDAGLLRLIGSLTRRG